MFLFYLEIVNKMRQVAIAFSEFTHSIKQPGGATLSLYDCLQSSNLVKFTLKNVQNCSQSMQAVEITL